MVHSSRIQVMGLFSSCFDNKARWYLDAFKTSRIKQISIRLELSVWSSVLALTDCVRPALLWPCDLRLHLTKTQISSL